MKIRLIGDVHGKQQEYVRLASEATHSLQVGDMGFSYNDLLDLNPDRHKFISGNHDNPDRYKESPHFLGRFGFWESVNIFYAGGGFSIDKNYRTPYIDWWPDEELSYSEMTSARELFQRIKPYCMVSHDCPHFLLDHIMGHVSKSSTNVFLDSLYEIHKPKLHIFGHHHKSKRFKYNDTEFICLAELEYIDIET